MSDAPQVPRPELLGQQPQRSPVAERIIADLLGEPQSLKLDKAMAAIRQLEQRVADLQWYLDHHNHNGKDGLTSMPLFTPMPAAPEES